jgi:carbon storage regulator
MLKLQRQVGESVIIGDDVRVVVLRVNGRNKDTRRIRLGLIAPDATAVHRDEIQQRILRGEPPPENK